MFKSELDMRATEPGFCRLIAPLLWDDRHTAVHGKAFGIVEVPAGTVTDLGSTPQLLHRFKAFDPWHTARRPATVHDYLYNKGKWPDGRPVTREQADEFLRVAMIAEGHSAFVARSWWFGVRSGGWLPWNAYRKADADTAASVPPRWPPPQL